jgi:hypothetical protein
MRRFSVVVLVVLFFAAATAYLAWPLPRYLATRVVDKGPGALAAWDRADVDLLVWVLAWDAHALATAPADVFQGNIFYPAPDVLASSEHLLGLAPIAAPTFLTTGNAVLTYNVTLLACVMIAGIATFALVQGLTGSVAAGVLAGAAFAFSPLNLEGWTRLHSTAISLFPLVVLFAWRAALEPRAGTLALLALSTALQLLAGIYVSFELATMLAVLVPFLWWEARRHGRTGLAPIAAMAVGSLALVPIAFPYLRARAVGTLPQYLGDTVLAIPFDALLLRLGTALTWPVVALAAVGALVPRGASWPLRVGLALVIVVGVLMCLGPAAPLLPGTDIPGLWALAAHFVPGFAGMRGATRFVVLPALGLAVLAGIGGAVLGRRLGWAGSTLLLAGGLALVVVRTPRPGIGVTPVSLKGPRMAAYAWLAHHGDGRAVLELPIMRSGMEFGPLSDTGRYMLGSTLHWAPLVNGYTGHPPPSYTILAALGQRLPRRDAFEPLCDLIRLGWVVVHEGSLHPRDRPQWQTTRLPIPLVPVWSGAGDVIYRVEERCGALEPELRHELTVPDEGFAGRTITGVSRAPLPASARRASLVAELPTEGIAGLYASLWTRVGNESDVIWPGATTREPGRLALQARWRDATSGVVVHESPLEPLARDLAPGQTVEAFVGTMLPPPGQYHLEVGLLQEGVGWFNDGADDTAIVRGDATIRAWSRPEPPPAPIP